MFMFMQAMCMRARPAHACIALPHSDTRNVYRNVRVPIDVRDVRGPLLSLLLPCLLLLPPPPPPPQLHLICEQSLVGLNTRRAAEGLPPVGMDRFRPNLVVSGCPAAHAEDSWKAVTIGGASFTVTHPCPRCTVPDVAQQTGRVDVAGAGPMRTLRDYRARASFGVLFGVYMAPDAPGASVRVGDAVRVVS